MLIKGLSCFSSGSHFVQWSKTILAFLVKEHFYEIILILGHWPMRCRLKVFLFFSSGGLAE